MDRVVFLEVDRGGVLEYAVENPLHLDQDSVMTMIVSRQISYLIYRGYFKTELADIIPMFLYK